MKTELSIRQALNSFDRRLPEYAAGEAARVYRNARGEHAIMLRCEGLTYAEIGRRLGVCREWSKRYITLGSQDLQRGMSRTKFRLT